jgi:hypothetical protein
VDTNSIVLAEEVTYPPQTATQGERCDDVVLLGWIYDVLIVLHICIYLYKAILGAPALRVSACNPAATSASNTFAELPMPAHIEPSLQLVSDLQDYARQVDENRYQVSLLQMQQLLEQSQSRYLRAIVARAQTQWAPPYTRRFQ